MVEFAATPPPDRGPVPDELASGGISGLNAALYRVDDDAAPAANDEPLTTNVAWPGPTVVIEPAPVPVFALPPPLLVIEPDISVVQDHEVPVYYTEKQYWMARDEGWYHSPRWDQPWVVATVEIVPKVIVHRDHRRYVRYRGEPTHQVWREPAVRYTGPPIFYDPPPLVAVQQDVYVVEDYDAPVYYTGDHYWQHRDNRWYRTARWNEPWIDIDVSIVPGGISRRNHHEYVRYRDHKRDHVFREARHARADARREARLLRETRIELNRERARLAAERERRADRRRLAAERDRREDRERARREDARLEADKARDRRERSRVAADRAAKERRDKARIASDREAAERREKAGIAADREAKERREKAGIASDARERRDRARIAADRIAAQKEAELRRERARLEAAKNKRPVPAAAPREERRRVDVKPREPARVKVEDKRRAPTKVEAPRDRPKVKIIKKTVPAPAKRVPPGKERKR